MLAITEFNSWTDLKKAFARRPLWGFRGQSNFGWPLETNLHREASRNGSIKYLSLLSREKWILYQFQRFAHRYKDNFAALDTPLDWLALIQHYGGPTRLLDFTYSLYIAAFFAIESSSSDAAIWALDIQALEASAHERLNFFPSGMINETRRANNEKFNELFNEPSTARTVIPVEPDAMHERMWIQKGLFLSPTHPNISFMANLAASFGTTMKELSRQRVQPWSDELNQRSWSDPGESDKIALVKIRVPRDQHEEIINDLELMNINAATLFPGLEGFAGSLKYHV